METILKSDIFFVITSVAVVLLTVSLIVVLVYIVKILRDIKSLSTKIKEEGEEIVDDAHAARVVLKKQTKKVGSFINLTRSRHTSGSKKHGTKKGK